MKRSPALLENELAGLLGSDRDAHIAIRYYGFDGQGGRTLQAAGDEVGLTKERIRQIVNATSRRVNVRRASTPALDGTISFVAEHIPAAADEIEAELLSNGLTASSFRMEGVVRAAELLGKPLPFRITEVRGERVVHAGIDRDSFERLIRVARGNVRHWGMSTISRVEAQVFHPGAGSSRNLVTGILGGQEGFHWLDESHEWFWFSNVPGNRVLARIAKILCVASPIGIADLRAGIARDYKMHDWHPPDSVLLQLCEQLPGLRADNGAIRAEPAIRPGDALSRIEREIVQGLAQNGGWMERSEFMETFLRQGFKASTLYAHLSYSPIIETPSRDHCGLIGASRTHH